MPPTLRRQIEAGRAFRHQVESYWEACEQWADAELEQAGRDREGAEKKGSKRSSRERSKRSQVPQGVENWIWRRWKGRRGGKGYGWPRESWSDA